MDNVFIDTSVFISNNFFAGSKIKGILTLAKEGYIRIIISPITICEIKKHGLSQIKTALDRVINNKILKNAASLNGLLNINRQQVEEEFSVLLDNKLKEAKCIILEYPKETESVFEKYFQNKYPFNKAEKKHEFPDAFVIASLESWCLENSSTCHILSEDKDFHGYNSKYLTVIDFETLLDQELRKIKKRQKRIERITALFSEKKTSLKESVERWISTQIEDEIYEENSEIAIHSIEIPFDGISLDDFKLISITDHFAEIECDVGVSLEIDIEKDDEDSGFYNKISDGFEFAKRKTESKFLEKYIPVCFKINIPVAGDEYMDFEIEEVNNGKNLFE